MQIYSLTSLLEFQGFRISMIELVRCGRGLSTIRVHLERTEQGCYICGKCGQRVSQGYDHTMQELWHFPLWHHQTIVRYPRFRVKCPRCGICTEALDFADMRGPRVSRPLAMLIAQLCKVMSNKAVAIFYGLHEHTVKDIDKAALVEEQANRPLDGITVVGADELAVGKGHKRYWSLFSALEGPRGPEMLHIVEGRTQRKLNRFWRWFGPQRTSQVAYAVMDMCRAFEKSFRKHCGKDLHIIYDKFHVMRHLNGALNAVRKAELAKALGRFKETLSGKKFILLARRAHVRGNAREALDTVLAASPKLQKAHLLKEAFGHFWSYKSKTCALRFWNSWKAQLKWTRLKSYRNFVRMIERHLDGILAYCDKKVPLGYIEASNLKARNVVRRAYGYRDKEYMKLKIIQACTPWMIKFRPWQLTHSMLR